MQITTGLTMRKELELWGQWSSTCNPNSEVGCYKAQPFVERLSGSGLQIPESRLVEIDSAISRLFGSDEQLTHILVYYFQYNYSLRELAELLNKCTVKEVKFELPNQKRWTVNYLKQLLDVSIAKLEGYVFAML